MAQKKLVFIILSLFIFIACSSNQASRRTDSQAAIPVVTQTVKTTSIPDPLIISGNVEGNRTVRLGFLVGGRINFIGPAEGEHVNKGELVARLDSTNYSIAKSMADVQVRQARDEYKRLRLMHKRKSISESDFKKAGFALENALNQQRLRAKNLSDTRLHSPIDGILLKKVMEVGEITGKGKPLLVISDIRKVKISAYIPEDELNAIQLGQHAAVTVSSIDSTYDGIITEIGSAADPDTRTFTIKIELDNPRELMRPGMIAEVKLDTIKSDRVITVPTEAVLHDIDNQAFVYVVDTERNKAFKRTVTVGEIVDNWVEITTGLNTGETIVTGGQHKLSDGSFITISK